MMSTSPRPGIVLGGGQHAVVLVAADVGPGQTPEQVEVATERPHAEHRILGPRLDVHRPASRSRGCRWPGPRAHRHGPPRRPGRSSRWRPAPCWPGTRWRRQTAGPGPPSKSAAISSGTAAARCRLVQQVRRVVRRAAVRRRTLRCRARAPALVHSTRDGWSAARYPPSIGATTSCATRCSSESSASVESTHASASPTIRRRPDLC